MKKISKIINLIEELIVFVEEERSAKKLLNTLKSIKKEYNIKEKFSHKYEIMLRELVQIECIISDIDTTTSHSTYIKIIYHLGSKFRFYKQSFYNNEIFHTDFNPIEETCKRLLRELLDIQVLNLEK